MTQEHDMCYDVHVSVPFANVHSCVLAVLAQIQCPPRHHHTVNLATLPGSHGVFVVITATDLPVLCGSVLAPPCCVEAEH